MLETLAHRGFAAEVLCGCLVRACRQVDPAEILTERGYALGASGSDVGQKGNLGVAGFGTPHLRTEVGGVSITVPHRVLRPPQEPDDLEKADILRLLDSLLTGHPTSILAACGCDSLTTEVLAQARIRGIATALILDSFEYRRAEPFLHADMVLTPSRFAADYYHEALSLACTVLPPLVDAERARASRLQPKYLTILSPAAEEGGYVSARIARELCHRRPDIRMLLVEKPSGGTSPAEICPELRSNRNITFRESAPDRRDIWDATRICLLPLLLSVA